MHLVLQVLTAGPLFATEVADEEGDWATVSVAFGSWFLLNHSWKGALARGMALISSEVHSFGAVLAKGIGTDADALAVAAMTRAKLRGGSHIISLPGMVWSVFCPDAMSGIGGIGFSTWFMVSSAAMLCARLR
jgi:hypothetical protein